MKGARAEPQSLSYISCTASLSANDSMRLSPARISSNPYHIYEEPWPPYNKSLLHLESVGFHFGKVSSFAVAVVDEGEMAGQ